MIDFLIDLDTDIFLWLNDHHCVFFDYFMMAFTGKWIWVPMYLLMMYIMFRKFGWRKASIYVIGVIIAIALTDQLCANVIRPIVERMRPSNIYNPISNEVHIVDGYRGGAFGFPSCHAANSFALATFMSLLFATRRFTIFILLWAFINSYTRLYLGVHYPGDLIIGAIIGSGIGLLSFACSKCVSDKISTEKISHKNYRLTLGKISLRYRHSDFIILGGGAISLTLLAYSLVVWC